PPAWLAHRARARRLRCHVLQRAGGGTVSACRLAGEKRGAAPLRAGQFRDARVFVAERLSCITGDVDCPASDKSCSDARCATASSGACMMRQEVFSVACIVSPESLGYVWSKPAFAGQVMTT